MTSNPQLSLPKYFTTSFHSFCQVNAHERAWGCLLDLSVSLPAIASSCDVPHGRMN